MTNKKILAIGAHPDDMELEAGGTLAKWALKGHEVYLLVLTSGEYHGTDGQIYKTEMLKNEAKKASKILKIKELRFLNYIATELPSNGKIISEVDHILQEINPDVLISHHPFDTHQDHMAAAHIMFAIARQGRVKNALSCSPLPYRPNVFAFRPQLFIDISSTMDLKLAAIRSYKSQYEKFEGEKLINRVSSMAQMAGWAVNTDYAESFEVVRMSDFLE